MEFSLNATFQSSIGCSPAEIIFGRVLNKNIFKKCSLLKNISEYKRAIDTVRTDQRRNIEIKNTRNKYDNSKRTHRTFNIGDLILVKQDVRSKHENRFVGPFRILSQIHDNSYKVQNIKTKDILIRNVEWLKPYREGGM